jgi:lantibiotic biosynthesis protein
VASGVAGLALFEMTLESLFGAGHAARAQRRLDEAVDLASGGGFPGLFNGLAGIGWVLDTLVNDVDTPEDEDPNRGIDAELASFLARVSVRSNYDLISGDVGIGLYGLTRTHRASGRRIVELVLQRLAETAKRDRSGAFWQNDPEWIPRDLRFDRQGPYVDLSLAHGVAGVVAVLGVACIRGYGDAATRELLSDAARWLLSHGQTSDARSLFPSWVGEGITPRPSRTAWCYGDPGIASALWFAGQGLGDERLRGEALRVARAAAARAPEHTGVADPALCHGSSGLAHVFGGFFRVTGEAGFRQASTEWFERTLRFRRAGAGVAGFASGDASGARRQDTSLLTGTAGIGLALASALTDDVPAWDDIFFVPK